MGLIPMGTGDWLQFEVRDEVSDRASERDGEIANGGAVDPLPSSVFRSSFFLLLASVLPFTVSSDWQTFRINFGVLI